MEFSFLDRLLGIHSPPDWDKLLDIDKKNTESIAPHRLGSNASTSLTKFEDLTAIDQRTPEVLNAVAEKQC